MKVADPEYTAVQDKEGEDYTCWMIFCNMIDNCCFCLETWCI
jgi:hypothetical protein